MGWRGACEVGGRGGGRWEEKQAITLQPWPGPRYAWLGLKGDVGFADYKQHHPGE